MRRETTVLRLLLVLVLTLLALASGLFYIVSLDAAASYPEWAHLRVPNYLAVLVGLLPVVVAVKVVCNALGLTFRTSQ